MQESANELIQEDLDFFETELATGGCYDVDYQVQCRNRIKQLRKQMDEKNVLLNETDQKESAVVTKTQERQRVNREEDLAKGAVKLVDGTSGSLRSKALNIPLTQRVQLDVESLRNKSDYKSAFKKYIQENSTINEVFLDKNFAIFDSWERNAIVSMKQMGEDFLEKYFGALDPDKIARYQLFSESFFMRHFAQMDAHSVLEQGQNQWRKKENRSKQLDVFLRLKGVKI